MSYRSMRMLVFFDLPTETDADRREYRRFRKMLIKNGFLMLQESVYCELLLNSTAQTAMAELLRRHRPPAGIVQVMTVTEKQFSKIEYITGKGHSDVVDTDERLVDFMELVRGYDRDKLFVIVGLRGLFGDEEVGRFLKTVLDHGYRVLLMDTVARERLPNEKRLTIDNDLCEF